MLMHNIPMKMLQLMTQWVHAQPITGIKIDEECDANDPSKKNPQDDHDFTEGDIVLVLRKSLHWPKY